MTILPRFFLLFCMCLLMVAPVQAQQGSDISGNTPATLSDQSGVSATNSDGFFFQSDEAKVRMSDVASSLAQALRSGQLGPSVLGGSQSTTVSPIAIDLLSRKNVNAAKQAFISEMTAKGLPNDDAKTLAKAVSGLLDGGTITPFQFQTALQSYNAAVDAAPTGFLAQPPHEFIVVRAVLTTLLQSVA